MSTLDSRQVEDLLEPYLQRDGARAALPPHLFAQLGSYLDLLVRWNAKTNLTAIREPEAMVRRHFGESLFAGLCLRDLVPAQATVLDLGSGGGFPGVPLQLLYPEMRVTLAESQGKKAAFLREVVRSLGLRTEVWAARAEGLAGTRRFDAVTLRAVDRMQAMVEVGRSLLNPGGVLMQLTGAEDGGDGGIPVPDRAGSFVRVSFVGT